MTSKRGRPVLLLAIALSLLVHLFVAGLVRWPFALQREKPEYVSLSTQVLRLTRATPSPRPPIRTLPHPRPAPTAKPVRSSTRTRVPMKKVAGAPAGGHAKAAAAAAARPSPRPTVLPKRAPCAVPDAAAAVLGTPAPPEIAPQARADDISGTTSVRVTLDRNANVTGATVVGSSGSGALDMVALQMARDAVYAPRYVKCAAVPGSYTFTVKFVAW